jgi:hypothetical protein
MSPDQWRVMRAIEICRTAALGGHVDRCDECGHQVISYNSCRNRHCPKCQSLAKAQWLQARQQEILPVEYYHVVFTLPDLFAPLALQNKQIIYDILFRATAQTLLTISSDPKHLGAKIGFLAILHTWGQNLLHHPHLHCVVSGGGISPDGQQWISCQKGFFLPVRVLSRLYRRIFLAELSKTYQKDGLEFYGNLKHLSEPKNFDQLLQSARSLDWIVYAKPPFAGPEKVVDYLSRYTHRIAISNHRILSLEGGKVSFRWKDYRHGNKQRIMTVDATEFIRRFLLHVLPDAYVRIRYYGFLANCHRSRLLKLCRNLLSVEKTPETQSTERPDWATLLESLTGIDPFLCPRCRKGHLIRFETFNPPEKRYAQLRAPPTAGMQ